MFLWFSYGFPMVFLWFSQGRWMRMPRMPRMPRALPPMKGDCRAGEATGERSTSSVHARLTHLELVDISIYIYVDIYIYMGKL